MSRLFQVEVSSPKYNRGLDTFVTANSKERAVEVYKEYLKSEHYTGMMELLGKEGVKLSRLMETAELIECPGVTINDLRNECVIFSLSDVTTDWTLKENPDINNGKVTVEEGD